MSDPTDAMAARTGSERAQLDAFLDDARAEVVEVMQGLSDEQARRRLVTSLTCPLSLLKHLVFVEQNWFHVTLGGRSRAEVGIVDDSQDSWVLADDDTVLGLLADYRRVCAEAREIGARRTTSTTGCATGSSARSRCGGCCCT